METKTPAGLVSLESVPALIERIDLRFKSGNAIQADRAHVRTEEWGRIRALLSAPAIVVSDAMVDRAHTAYMASTQRPIWEALKLVIEAALRPTGEDRG